MTSTASKTSAVARTSSPAEYDPLTPRNHPITARADEPTEVSDGVDERDAGRRRRAAEEHRRNGPEDALDGPLAELRQGEAENDERHAVVKPRGEHEPEAPVIAHAATWPLRSPVRSECRPISTMPTSATTNGSAVTRLSRQPR